MNSRLVSAEEWFAGGTRRGYDPVEAVMSDHADLRVFEYVHASARAEDGPWTTFLPGFPDGSYGYSQVDAHLGDAVTPRLFVEYVGQGDSDKPRDYRYGVAERADLVEAHWRDREIEVTAVVSFDYSSLVVLELLARQHAREVAGTESTTRIESILLINGGLFADAHTHPWQATPMLKTIAGRVGMWATQRSPRTFAQVIRTARLYSRDYAVSNAELREEYTAITRRHGAAFLHQAAGFVDEHRANAERWDLARLYHLLSNTVDFHIAGSVDDPYEHRQIDAARQRLGDTRVDIRMFPGGHMTTSEHPDLLADAIAEITNPRAKVTTTSTTMTDTEAPTQRLHHAPDVLR